ncbi:hypothetical protein DSECCO2_663170 [anaerobic digester metagenome]
MVPYGIFIIGTVLYRVGTSSYQPLLVEFGELPGYEFLVVGIDGGEFTSPVDGITHMSHYIMVLFTEVFNNIMRVCKFVKRFFRYFMDVLIYIQGPGISSFDTLGYADDWSSSYMPGHGK